MRVHHFRTPSGAAASLHPADPEADKRLIARFPHTPLLWLRTQGHSVLLKDPEWTGLMHAAAEERDFTSPSKVTELRGSNLYVEGVLIAASTSESSDLSSTSSAVCEASLIMRHAASTPAAVQATLKKLREEVQYYAQGGQAVVHWKTVPWRGLIQRSVCVYAELHAPGDALTEDVKWLSDPSQPLLSFSPLDLREHFEHDDAAATVTIRAGRSLDSVQGGHITLPSVHGG